MPPSSAPAVMEYADNDGDGMPGMTVSQGTLSSTQGSFRQNESAYAANSRKRTYEEEVEDDLDAYFDDIDAEPILPPTQRPIARMKQPGKKVVQNVAAQVASRDDFEDAIFLALEDGMEVDGT